MSDTLTMRDGFGKINTLADFFRRIPFKFCSFFFFYYFLNLLIYLFIYLKAMEKLQHQPPFQVNIKQL